MSSKFKSDRLSSKRNLSQEELIKRKTANQEIIELARPIFEQIRPQLIEKHYNWFVAIDPDSGNYLIDPTLQGISEKVINNYTPQGISSALFCLNESGSCGKI